MKLGISMFPTDYAIPPGELARAVEARGFESLWFPEHSHIPVSRETPWGGVPGAKPLPEMYWHTHDQFVSLTAAAAATTSLLVGIGYGWNREELASHGVAYQDRRALLREKVLMMKSLWEDDAASFSGELLQLEPSWAWPKPMQRPHPPIILGGAAGPKTLRHIVEFCDGWMPLYGRHPIIENVAKLRAAAEEQGRDPASIAIGVFSAPRDRGQLRELAAAGVTRAVFGITPGPVEQVTVKLDEYAGFLEDLG
jgi:alkanesulfonate monooxygenase SsuD/methylene tetrahydromethanopterin reductase-like flavin-dependent oxidoreductase (luciferase family)